MSSCRRPGISLLEVVVGMTIIGVTVVSALATSSAELRGAGQAVAIAEINALAEFKLNEAILELGHARAPAARAPAIFERFPEPMTAYEWRVTIRGPSSDGLVQLSATVRSAAAERTLHAVRPWPTAHRP